MPIQVCDNRKCHHWNEEEPDYCKSPLYGEISQCEKAIPKDKPTLKEAGFYIRELRSNQCQCEAPKKPGNSFCYSCYTDLPLDMRSALYRKLGSGYEDAYDAAVKYLTEV